MEANTGISLILAVVFIIKKYPFSFTSRERAFNDDITKPSSKTLPSYFSWSLTTTPIIFELFLASKIPAIFGMYPDLSSSCWTRFIVSSEIFSVLPWITFETVAVLRPNASATSTIRTLSCSMLIPSFPNLVITWYNRNIIFSKVKRVTRNKICVWFLWKTTGTMAFFMSPGGF